MEKTIMIKTSLKLATVMFFMVLLNGCAPRYEEMPAGTVRDINDSSAVLELQEVTVPPPILESDIILDYRVGPGDVLVINVPGLIDSRGSDEKTQNYQGFRIASSGNIILPLVGAVNVNGLTVEEIQNVLTEKIRTYIKKPMVTVEIRDFKSQPLYLLGKFNSPGLQYLDRPTSLLHGIAMGKGVDETANLRSARLLRSDQVMPVDIYHLLHNNDMRQNVQLHPGDTIFIPGNEDQQVFAFGAVDSPGPIPMLNGRLNILQALSSASVGGTGDKKYPYDKEHVRIIRSLSPTHGQLMVVDLGKMMNGYAMPMPLMNGDIIYVPETPVGDWNTAIARLLPSLQLVSGLMQPFVQYVYLRDNW